MDDIWIDLHSRAMDIIREYGAVAMSADSALGPLNLVQCWNACFEILTPEICEQDQYRPVPWYRNWNRPQIRFVNKLNELYSQQRNR